MLFEAAARKLGASFISLQLSQIALAEGDEATRKREDALEAATPDGQARLTLRDARLAASRGQLHQASDLFKRAGEQAIQLNLKEASANGAAEQGAIEALFGDRQQAIRDANAAMAISQSPNVKLSVAIALALAGEDAKAQALAGQVAKSRPLDTLVQSVAVPTIQAIIETGHGNAAKAIELLESARPYDRVDAETRFTRANAYLKANRASDAVQEYQAIIALKNINPANPVLSLAHLGLARAYALQGDKVKARTTYQDFLALWKDADPDLPILKEAKAEYAKLQP